VAVQRPAFRPDVEGLRAVAVILVVLNHLLAVPAGGFIGVDLFFVISGFVITGMLWRQTKERTFSFRSFFVRRVRRLLPSALLVLLVTNLAVQYLFLGPRVQQTRTDTGWTLAFLANVHMSRTHTDYFHANDAPSLLQHFWSLAVEEQFYFVWPLVLVLLALLARRRAGAALVLPVTLALTVASFVYALHLVSLNPEKAYFSSPARAWELGAGAFLGLLVAWGLKVPGWLQHSFAWMGVGLVVVACIFIDPTLPFPGATALVPVGAGLALILAGTGRARPGVTRVLEWPVATYIGRISYPIYLWHWPVIVISEEVWGRNTMVWVAAPFVSVMLAILTHHLVEDPLRGRVRPRQAYRELLPMLRGNGLHKWAPLQNFAIGSMGYVLVLTTIAVTSVPTVAAALIPTSERVVASGSGASVLANESAPAEQVALSSAIEKAIRASKWGRLDPNIDALDAARAPEWIQSNCLNVTPETEARCVFGSVRARHHAVIIGDSIAVSYLPGLRDALEPLGWDFQLLTMALCNNAVGVIQDGKPYTACDDHRRWALAEVSRLRPELVMLSNVTNIDNIVPSLVVGTRLDTWEAGLAGSIHALLRSGAKVVVLSPPPGGTKLTTCDTRFATPQDCVTRVPESWDRMSAAEEQAAASQGAAYVNTSDWFCYFGVCPAVVGDMPVYVDGVHLTARYSRRLAPLMAHEILWASGHGSKPAKGHS
jgi:peptidoglycan/LPS O-acetylase OafA/YrhL